MDQDAGGSTRTLYKDSLDDQHPQPTSAGFGNSELLDRTVRSNNWIRSDTIFIENEQIEALSNRPPWIAAVARTAAARQSSGDSLRPRRDLRVRPT